VTPISHPAVFSEIFLLFLRFLWILIFLNVFYMVLIVSIGLNGYLNRYASNWTNFQLKRPILDPNRCIFGNRPMATGVGHHSPRAQGAVMNCALKNTYFLSLQTAARLRNASELSPIFAFAFINNDFEHFGVQSSPCPSQATSAFRDVPQKPPESCERLPSGLPETSQRDLPEKVPRTGF